MSLQFDQSVYGTRYHYGQGGRIEDPLDHWDEIDSLILAHHTDRKPQYSHQDHFMRLVFRNKNDEEHEYDEDISMFAWLNKLWICSQNIESEEVNGQKLILSFSAGIGDPHSYVCFENPPPEALSGEPLVLDENFHIATLASTIKVKKNIKDYKLNYRTVLSNLKLKTYTNLKNTVRSIGYIAEQIEKVNKFLPIYKTHKKHTKKQKKQPTKKELKTYNKDVIIFALVEICKKLLKINLDELAQKFPSPNIEEKEEEIELPQYKEKSKIKEIEIEIEKEKEEKPLFKKRKTNKL